MNYHYDSDTGRETELVVGPLRGYRTWTMDPEGMLWSRGVFYKWQGTCLTAECVNDARIHLRCERSPVRGCTCGIYGLHTPYSDPQYPVTDTVLTGTNDVISGVIAGSGAVRMGRRGFKASQARLEAVAYDVDNVTIDDAVWISSCPGVLLIQAHLPEARPVTFHVSPPSLMYPRLPRVYEVTQYITQQFKYLDARFRRQYPDVQVFASAVEMVAALPPIPVAQLLT